MHGFSRILLNLLLLVISTSDLAYANDEVRKLIQNSNYWAYPGGDYNNWRYSELKEINNRNVHNLVVTWTFSTGSGLQGQEGEPLILPSSATGLGSDHMFMYSSSRGEVIVIDLDTLGITWSYEHQQDEPETVSEGRSDMVSRGLSYGDGKIFFLRSDAKLIALDAKTGKVIWRTGFKGISNTTTPYVVKDKVLIGILSTESESRSLVAAFNIKDGSLIWKAYSTGPDGDILFDKRTTSLRKRVGKNSGLNTWKGDQWKFSGGSISGWWSADFKQNLVYYGTGNINIWNLKSSPGDNKWSMSIFARDIDTGIARWVYQMTPHDEWDYDDINGMTLADIKIKNKLRKVLVNIDNKGFAFTIDRISGELLVADKYDPSAKWATDIDIKTGLANIEKLHFPYRGDVTTMDVCKAALGIKDRQPSAYNPHTKLFYIPTNRACISSEGYITGSTIKTGPNVNMGNMIAWDASKGKIVWSIPERWPVWSGALTTAGGVIFYGTLDSTLKAIDAKSGRLLWRFGMPSGIIGSLNTWSHRGKQYIGTLSGIGGWAGAVVSIRGMAATPDVAALGAVGGYRRQLRSAQNRGVFMAFSLSEQREPHNLGTGGIPSATGVVPAGVAVLTSGTGGLSLEARGIMTSTGRTLQPPIIEEPRQTIDVGSTQLKTSGKDELIAHWNNWFQKQNADGTVRKIENLMVSDLITYDFVLDISPYNYQALIGGVVKSSVTDHRFQKKIDKLIKAGTSEITLMIRPIVIGDHLTLTNLEHSHTTFRINLKKLKKEYNSQITLINDLKTGKITLQKFATSVQAGEKRFSFKANVAGCAAIGISVWDESGLIPYDHIVRTVSVYEPDKPLPDCGKIENKLVAGFNTLLTRLVDFSDHPPPKPDASLNIFETKINGVAKSVAIFVDKRYINIPSSERDKGKNSVLFWEMRSVLSGNYMLKELPSLLDTARTNASNGRAYPYKIVAEHLAKKIFSSRRNSDKSAAKALKQLKDLSREKKQAVILVRLISKDNQLLYLPMNLLSAKAEKPILKNPITVIQQLSRERYMSKKICVDPWTFGIPEQLQGIPDMMGIEEFSQLSKYEWWERKESIDELIKYFKEDGKKNKKGEGLLLLAHHNNGNLWYEDEQNMVIPEDIVRIYSPGSVAILAACSAAGVSSESRKILKDLNELNMIDTIIVSPFQVRGSYGSRFAYEFALSIFAAREDKKQPTITDLFWSASKKTAIYFNLKDKNKHVEEMALEFVILGDQNIRLCIN